MATVFTGSRAPISDDRDGIHMLSSQLFWHVNGTPTAAATYVARSDPDVALLPTLLDHRIAARVNKELASKHIELAWKFVDT